MNSMFGTDGIRARIGNYPLQLEQSAHLGYVLGRWFANKYGAFSSLLLAHDTRASCSFLKSALKSGLYASSINIYDAGVVPTPAVFALIEQHTTINFAGGIIISASHNPYYDNGIKIVTRNGKLSETEEAEIEALCLNLKNYSYTDFGQEYLMPSAIDQYLECIAKKFRNNLCDELKIVLDCAHGATSMIAPKLFSALKAHCIPINNKPNGININDQCGSTHPNSLQEAVLSYKADIGFAFDGDGDRLIIVNNKGHIKDGDDILALLMQHPLYQNDNAVVGTVMSNQGLDYYLKQQNKRLIRAAVGDKHVAEQLTKHNLMVGGEPSGHIILRDYLKSGDGIFAALRIIEIMIISHNKDLETFQKFPQVIINVPITIKKDLNKTPLADIISASSHQLPNGRALVRYSGTESLLRIMIEDQDYHHAAVVAKALAQALSKELS